MKNNICGFCGKEDNNLVPMTYEDKFDNRKAVLPICPKCLAWYIFYSAFLINKIIYGR